VALRCGHFRGIGQRGEAPRARGRTVETMVVRLFSELEALADGVPVPVPVRGARQRTLRAQIG
jgi:hypothetical protein